MTAEPSTQHRFVLLDALRGLAAVFVLFRHTGQFWHFGFYRSYLAVDVFFLLSGFVIAFAYDEKLRTGAMTLGSFLLVRLIRMYPVYLLSVGLCLLIWWDRLGDVGLVLALTALFLPWPAPGNASLFALNGPYWSLFYELVANLLYGWIRPLLTNLVLRSVLIVAGLGVAAAAWLHGNLDSGFLWNPESYLAGFSRSLFGIFLGVLLHRHYERLARWVSLVPPWLAFVLVGVILASPPLPGFNAAIDLACVFVAFPLLVLAASRYRSGRGAPVLLAMGAASYPLYVVHQQMGTIVQFLTGSWVQAQAPWSGVLFLSGLLCFAVLLERRVDAPLRRWLRKTLL